MLEDVHELGLEAWQPEGLVVLGTPIDILGFVSKKMHSRIEEERRLWKTILSVPDLLWRVATLGAKCEPQAIHSLRTMRPSRTAECARVPDQDMWQTAEIPFQQTPGTDAERASATLPIDGRNGTRVQPDAQSGRSGHRGQTPSQ